MSQLDELRSQMREHGIKFTITKNRITKIALEKTTFEKHGLSEEVAIENARLARILRNGEYNFDTKEVKLWAA